MKYKDILALVHCHFGGSGTTSTQGQIAPELRGLYQSSADALVGQQSENPLGQYNESNPLDVEGANPLQQYGASMMMGGNLPTGLDSLALQSIMRGPGLAGAGPTSGQYDYGSEAGLGDYQAFMNPAMGAVGGEDGFSFPRANQTADMPNVGPGENAAASDFSGLGAALAPPPAGSGFNPLSDQGPGGAYGGGQGGGQQVGPGALQMSQIMRSDNNVNPASNGGQHINSRFRLSDGSMPTDTALPGLGANNYQFTGGQHDLADPRAVLERAGMDYNADSLGQYRDWVARTSAAQRTYREGAAGDPNVQAQRASGNAEAAAMGAAIPGFGQGGNWGTFEQRLAAANSVPNLSDDVISAAAIRNQPLNSAGGQAAATNSTMSAVANRAPGAGPTVHNPTQDNAQGPVSRANPRRPRSVTRS